MGLNFGHNVLFKINLRNENWTKIEYQNKFCVAICCDLINRIKFLAFMTLVEVAVAFKTFYFYSVYSIFT